MPFGNFVLIINRYMKQMYNTISENSSWFLICNESANIYYTTNTLSTNPLDLMKY